MKIPYYHLIEHIASKPSIEELSENLFQLGHEHEIVENIFDIEFTPNRGDCLSLNGLLRDLSVFYSINLNYDIYNGDIKSFPINFENNQPIACPNISFLKIEIDKEISSYNNKLNKYFSDLEINKNNFFTDISNYVAYETGQPTHCYDASLLDNSISLDYIKGDFVFETLLDKKIHLNGSNLVFLKNKEIINLAGVVGGKSTSCSKATKSAIVECAYFRQEDIIGKSIKYDILSEAAHKFERSVDPLCHNKVLRRFIKIVSEHADIKNIEIFSKSYNKFEPTFIPYNVSLINKIIGIKISDKEYEHHLFKLGFTVEDNLIMVPSYRSDISTQNDIAEEIARVIGYDNIPSANIKIPSKSKENKLSKESKIKSLLVDNGFYEVINNPFEGNKINKSIEVDNPLDSNRKFLRTSLKESLIANLLYNERRQKDSIKLFEISDMYYVSKKSGSIKSNQVIGIICSGRAGKNFKDFSKKINSDYLISIIKKYTKKDKLIFDDISRNDLDTKLKNTIIYTEFEIGDINSKILDYKSLSKPSVSFIKYTPISEYPSSSRDLSVSINDPTILNEFEQVILKFYDELIIDSFIFDYFQNKKTGENKLGFRFIFQSNTKTLTDVEIDSVMSDIIELILSFRGVKIPGIDLSNDEN